MPEIIPIIDSESQAMDYGRSWKLKITFNDVQREARNTASWEFPVGELLSLSSIQISKVDLSLRGNRDGDNVSDRCEHRRSAEILVSFS